MPEYQPLNGINSAVSNSLCEILFKLAQEMDCIVEIGSWHGKSAHALLSGCKGIVHCVDHFNGSAKSSDATHGQNGKEEFLKNCGDFANLDLMEMYSDDASILFGDNMVDMVFIDAGHMYDEVLLDLRCWYPKAKKIICGHDWGMPEVKKAIDDFGLKCESPIAEYWEHRKD